MGATGVPLATEIYCVTVIDPPTGITRLLAIGKVCVKVVLATPAAAAGFSETPPATHSSVVPLQVIVTGEEALIRTLLDDQVPAPTAGEAECRRYYEARQDRFSTGDMWEAHHILLPLPASASNEERDRVAELGRLIIAELAAAPARFAELARLHSACPSREVGGSLGQLTPGSTVPEFEAALVALEAGQIATEPVRSRFGFHIIRLDRAIPGRRLPFEAVQERIAVHLEASSWSRGVSQLIGVLAERARITGATLGAAPHLSGGRQ